MAARILCAITTASLVACGGGGQQQQTSSTQGGELQTREVAVARPGCSYITEAEATAVLAQSSQYRSNDSTSNTCILDPTSGEMMNGVTVDFTVEPGMVGMYDYFTNQQGSEQLAGLGDRAVWQGTGSQGQLVAVKGGAAVMLTVTDMRRGANVKGEARAFAEKILTHW